MAASDAMFTGFAGAKDDFALVLIDEAFWNRAFEEIVGLTVDALPLLGIGGIAASRRRDAKGAGMADVVAARQKLADVLAGLAAGEVARVSLIAAGLDATFCMEANPNGAEALRRAGKGGVALRAAVVANADQHAADMAPVIAGLRATGHASLRAIADQLTQRGMLTRQGGHWHVSNVRNLLRRLEGQSAARSLSD